ncbi:MAG: DUF4270 family protein [Cyclobacteriaceae bacterium]
MNLWARTLRQLAVLAVALFFFSCEDDTSILGFKNPNKKLKVNFVDIPVESSVLLMDSLRTSNYYLSQGETNRLLVGKYNDDLFGEVSSNAITQFFTTSTAVTQFESGAVFDSVSLQLRFDFYSYGSLGFTPQTISVHEVENELMIDSLAYYFNKSNTPYNPTPLGTKTFAILPESFQEYINERKDTTITISLPLDAAFGQRIFDSAIKYRNATSTADSAFVNVSAFVKQFKGIAVVANDGDKVVGFNPSATASRITLHYHDTDTDSLQAHLSFTGVISYNQIKSNRSSTALAGLNQYSQPFTPDNNLRYIQAGTGTLTRLDFSRFYEFVDQDTNSTMIVNSAELHLGIPESTTYPQINVLSLRAITGEGHLKKIASRETNPAQYMADSTSLSLYAGQLGLAGNMFTPMSASGTMYTITQADSIHYNGFLTLFAQQLFKKEEHKVRFKYFALIPEDPQIAKSVNRLAFHEQNIKLRVYYTRPNEPTQ